jgi:mono/diheme cytochrome c family protein
MKTFSEIDQKAPRAVVVLALLAFVFVGLESFSATTGPASKSVPPQTDVARGKYLVENVAMCTECHTPRDAQGNLDAHAWLQGAPVWISPIRPIQNWADTVPPLAGLPSLTEAQVETVLEKGTGPEGEVLRPPMHIYHMTHADAQAIVAYLKSLPSGSH